MKKTTLSLAISLALWGGMQTANAAFLPIEEPTTLVKKRILKHPPRIGYLTISNALQWRLQYRRVIDKAGEVDGILRIR